MRVRTLYLNFILAILSKTNWISVSNRHSTVQNNMNCQQMTFSQQIRKKEKKKTRTRQTLYLWSYRHYWHWNGFRWWVYVKIVMNLELNANYKRITNFNKILFALSEQNTFKSECVKETRVYFLCIGKIHLSISPTILLLYIYVNC